jgi:hypothetical protein
VLWQQPGGNAAGRLAVIPPNAAFSFSEANCHLDLVHASIGSGACLCYVLSQRERNEVRENGNEVQGLMLSSSSAACLVQAAKPAAWPYPMWEHAARVSACCSQKGSNPNAATIMLPQVWLCAPRA